MLIASLLALLPLLGCNTTATVYPTTCELDAPVPEASARPGDSAWAVDSPMTSVNDTVVTIGSMQAIVLDVQRNDCDDLDTCRTDNSCSACSDCDACSAEASTCVERVRFTVPELAPGDHVLTIRNAFGSSRDGVFTVPGTDTGGTDTGGTDTGGTDTGGTDTGGTDTGGTDTGGTDTGGADTSDTAAP